MAKSRSAPVYNPFAELEHVRQEKSNDSVTQVPEVLSDQTPTSRAKSQNPDFVKLTAYVPRELHRATKARLVQQGREISDLIEELVSRWLRTESLRLE
jgi:hypothetical protein